MAVRIYGNRQIKTLPGESTRPTSSKVREALFNVWQGRVRGARWLDLCAGSGAMGAEALCRGAAQVVGIEKSAAALRVVQGNWQKVAKAEQAHAVIKGDVTKKLSTLGQFFDLIYFDPPYAGGLYLPVLSQLATVLTIEGEAAIEYDPQHWQLTQLPESLALVKEKRYGRTHLAFLKRQ
ncbi:MAG: 16S rRNA (guanine(966)-N(2))-methyltransferase RsmD [Cyanobacteria bacterium J06643_4]